MVCYYEPMVGNQGVKAIPVVVNHGELCSASGCESWCAMLSQWLRIMLCYSELIIGNHGMLCWASGCE